MHMGYEMNYPLPVESTRSERAAFIRRTYAHLAGTILAFLGLEALIFGVLSQTPALDEMMKFYFSSRISGLVLMVAFIGVSYLAHYWAFNGGSAAMQYAGLGLYVVAEAIIFVPILYFAMVLLGDYLIVVQAGILTLSLFAGLTTVVFITRKDFSFLGPILAIGFWIALGVAIIMVFIPGSLGGFGLLFSLAMIVLAAGAILYDTSNILHHFRMDQHVAASLSLFASVALLFYYVLLALLQTRR
jgi:FtsH-binding integral membrane protein